MDLKSAISILGGPAELAAAINVSSQVITNWLARNRVPAERCPSIERATKGAVTCEALRPDVDWAYLRKTCKAKAA